MCLNRRVDRERAYAPLFDLYSIIVDGGRCNTVRILSLLYASHIPDRRDET